MYHNIVIFENQQWSWKETMAIFASFPSLGEGEEEQEEKT
jgi:hypothetical protein